MGNKTTVEVTEQTLYNIDILEDETTTVEITIPQDIVTLEVSQFTVDVNIYNSLLDSEADAQPFYAKSGSDFTLKSFVDDDKTIDISEPSGDRIEIKLPDVGIKVPDDFTISANSNVSANITMSGDTIDLNNAKLLTDLDVNSQDLAGVNLITATTGNITTVNSTTVNTTDVNATTATMTGNVNANNAVITNNITAVDIDTDTGTIDVLNVTTAEASDEFIGDIRGAVRFRAKAGEALSKGDVVYVSGISGNTPVVNKARADSSSTMPAYGLAFDDANNNANVEIVTFGTLQGIDTATDSLQLDKPVYVSPTTAGTVTATRPTGPTHLVQNIGLVTRVHASAGSIKVGGAGRTNDVPNTFSIQGDITTAANISANNITLTNDVTADDVTTANLSVTDTATIATGDITTVNATTLNATNATLTGDIDAATGTIDTLDGVTVTYTTGNLTTVNATTVNTTDATLTGTLVAPTGNITTVNATNINGTDLALTGDISAVVDITTSGDVVIGGDLTVSGTTTTINTETLELADNNIVLNSNHTGSPTQDAGITVERGSSDDAVFQWNETDDKFEVLVGSSLATLKAADVETTNLTATLATVTTGNITTVNATNINGTTVDLDGGTIDGTTIGGTTSAAGTFSTMTTANAQVTGGTLSGITLTGVTSLGVEDLSVTDDATINDLIVQRNHGIADTDGGSIAFNYVHPSNSSLDEEIIHTSMNSGVSGPSALIKMKNLHIDEGVQFASESGSVKIGSGTTTDLISNFALGNMSNHDADIEMYGGDIEWETWQGDSLGLDAAIGVDSNYKVVIRGNKNTSYTGGGAQNNNYGGIILDGKNTSSSGDEHGVEIKGELTVSDTVSSHIIPTADNTYDLGSTSAKWRSLYLSGGSLYIEGQKVIGSDDGTIDFTTDDGENINIFAGANGPGGDVIINSASGITRLEGTDIRLNPVGSGTTTVRGTLEAADLHVSALEIEQNLFNNTGTNQNLEIRTNGTGFLHANVADVYVGTLTNATKIDENSIEVIGGDTLTVKDKLKVDSVVQVDDGFTMTSFNPYSGFGGTAMPTTFAGVGNEDGWASLHIRNRGEHDFGIGSQYNFSPRAILGLSAGRKDSGSDDYLDSGDKFGSVQFLPYSGYKTGTEWLTNSAEIAGVATENHSSTGLGTKLVFRTTTDGAEASASEASHTDAEITMQGTTISSDGDLKFDDDVVITGTTEFQGNLSSNGSVINVDDNLKTLGSNNNSVLMGDQQIGGTYDISAIKVIADENRWASLTLQEYVGGANKPFASGFANPTFGTEIIGGTYASPAAVASGKRLFMLQALAANQSDGTLPSTSNFRIKAETTEAQTTSARGTNLEIDTTPDGATSTTTSLRIQGSTVVVHPDGDGTLTTGGDLIIDDDLVVNNTLHVKTTSDFDGNVNMDGNLQVDGTLDVDGNATFDGNVTLGNGNTDVITSTGKLVTQNGLTLTNLPYNTLVYLDGLGIVDTGGVAFITDGARANRPVYYDGSDWRYMSDDAVIST